MGLGDKKIERMLKVKGKSKERSPDQKARPLTAVIRTRSQGSAPFNEDLKLPEIY